MFTNFTLDDAERMGRRLHVRWLIRRDMPEVLALDAHSYLGWPEKEYLYHLRQRNVIGMVAEEGERVVGAMIYRLDNGHIDLLKVTGDGDNTYAVLFDKLKAKLSSGRRNALLVTAHEADARLLRACRLNGLRAEQVHADLYYDGDGYQFSYRLEGK